MGICAQESKLLSLAIISLHFLTIPKVLLIFFMSKNIQQLPVSEQHILTVAEMQLAQINIRSEDVPFL